MNKDEELSRQQHNVLRNKATEVPFTGVLLDNKDDGKYCCAACGTELFSSNTKYDSGSGWPSFYDVANSGAVRLEDDSSMGIVRTEAVCSSCGGHLGHVFADGPKDQTGQRYCINSASLNFEPTDSTQPMKSGDNSLDQK